MCYHQANQRNSNPQSSQGRSSFVIKGIVPSDRFRRSNRAPGPVLIHR